MGHFIVFEGIDGSGTTTVSKEVAKRIGAIWHCEPTSGEIGKLIRKALKKEVGPFQSATLVNLFQADRIEHSIEIESLLEAGESVVCDRYFVSTAVYQSLSDEFRTSVSTLKKLCRRIFIHDFEHLCSPDVTFFCDVSVDTARKRRGIRGSSEEIFDADATQKMLRKLYTEYFKIYSANHHRINAESPVEKCVEQCLGILGDDHADE